MKKLLLLSFIYSTSLLAQKEHWQQFSNGSISQIQQHGDTIWTLTVSGLYAWDRKSNQRFEFNKKNCNIDFMQAERMLVDNSGNVWINLYQPPTYNDTNTYFLAKYDGAHWIKYTLQDLNPEVRPRIGNIVQSGDGKIFFKISRGFMTYYQNQFSIDTVPGYYTWIDWTDEIMTIAVDKLNHVWLGAEAGYFMFDGTFHDFALPGFLPWFTAHGEPHGRVDAISFDNNDVMWLGSGDNCSGSQGLYKVENGITSRLNYEDVYRISVDRNNNKWIMSEKGVQVYNDSNWTHIAFLDPCIYFSDICIDDKNNKFIGTYFGDEFIFDNQSWTVTSFRNSSLRSSINCIAVDSHDNYYFAGQSLTQFYKFDGTNWQIIPVTTNRINQSGYFDYMCIDKNDHIWLSQWNEGIYVYDLQGWKLINSSNSPIQSFDHLRISCDDQNRIWIVSPSDYIIYCYNNGNWTTYDISQIVSDAIYLRELETGPGGIVWLSLITSRFQYRILKFDGNNWEIIYKTGLEIVKMKYSNVYGLILATMNENVYPPYTCIKQINGTTVTNISQLCSNYGLISDTLDIQKKWITDIYTEDSTLWFLTDKMLTKFDGNNIFQYNTNNSDLNDDQFYCGAMDSKGNIVIGGLKTINIFYRNMIPNIINEDHLAVKDINLFPNPSVNGIVEIKSDEQFDSYKIYNMTGVLLSEKKLKSTEKYIDIINLSSGLYFIQLIGKESIVSIKHIVQ